MKTLFLSLLLIYPLVSISQISIQPGVVYGNYNMSSLKQFRNYLNSQANLKTVDDFPSTLDIDISILYKTSQLNFGFFYSHSNTGARSGVRDYSAHYRIDIPVSSNNFGIAGEKELRINRFLSISPGIRVGYCITKVEVIDELLPSDTNTQLYEKTSVEFKSSNIFINPQTKIDFKLLKHIGLVSRVGYSAHFTEPLMIDDFEVVTDSGSQIKADWSGLRLGFGISYTFKSGNEE
ncbi:hypothetical protein [Fulvivirga lutea]|uniref:Uncharacterized protein n=1 Tax=Fulvivirga lutea TaxID=2810512 RepID=A0A975A1D7_9BACT|nr:hypothetical protein [Fulvivirga lutea]QSE97422.1 hypothetical protein JR347_17865 [Fulvivirga lutea]